MTPLACRFRTKVLDPALRVALWETILLEILLWTSHRDRPLGEVLIVHLIAQSFFWMFWIVFFALFSLLCVIRVTPTGILCTFCPGLASEIPWERIVTVRYANLLGCRFLAIYPVGKFDSFGTWVPLFLRDEETFWDVVEACVPAHHPLRASRKKKP